ncbi:MAG: recombinase RecT [Caenispirillum sp.]|nr:recombinase RecT [Caenispirillum sp.]
MSGPVPAAARPNNRPALVQPSGANKKPETIKEFLEKPKTLELMRQAVPRHMNPERMLKVMVQAVWRVPKLAEAHPVTVLGAMMSLVSLGLEPDTPLGHAHLAPFDNRRKNPATGQWETITEVQVIIGYKGYIELARRSGQMQSIHADVVYEGDEFSFEYGSNMHLRHVPLGARGERKPLWAYAHARLKDGGQAFEVLPYEEVMATRDKTQSYRAAKAALDDAMADPSKAWRRKSWETAPWVAFEHEMAAKTMIRRLAKVLPMSIEFANAAALDAMSEAGRVELSHFADGSALAFSAFDAIRAEAPVDALESTAQVHEPAPIQGAGGNNTQAAEVAQPKPAPRPQAARTAAGNDFD